MITVNRIPVDPALHEYGQAVDRLELLATDAHQSRRRSTREICKKALTGIFALAVLQSDVLDINHPDELSATTVAFIGLSTIFEYRDLRRSGRQARQWAHQAVGLSDTFNVVPPVWALNEAR